MLGVGALLPLLAIPITPTYTVDASLWSSFAPSTEDFTVQMPGAPSKSGAMDQNIGNRIYEVDVANPQVKFTVFVSPSRVNNGLMFGASAAEQGYTDARNLLAAQYSLTYFTPAPSQRDGYRGLAYREFFYQIPSSSLGSGPNSGKSLAARVYVVNGEVVTLAVLGPRVKLEGSDVVKFFNSIQFTPPALALSFPMSRPT